MKILYFGFNMGTVDHSGLPTYSEKFVSEFSKTADLLVLNVIVNHNHSDRVERRDGWIDVYASQFFLAHSSDFEKLVREVVESFSPDYVVAQDHMCESYLTQFNNRKFKKVFFMHLCQRGLLMAYTKQPFFPYVAEGMGTLSKNCWDEWRAVATSDIIIANSEFTAREIRKYYPEVKAKVVIAPLGVGVDSLPFCPAVASTKWAYFGRLDSQKGINYLIKDFIDYPDQYRANPPVIIGDGTLDSLMMRAHMFDGFVNFKGEKDKASLIEELRDVGICIFPSIYEPYGLALNEALAMGKLCLVHNADSGMLEQLWDGARQNAFVSDLTSGIIHKVLALQSSDKTQLKRVSDNARRYARKEADHFSILHNVLV